MTESSSKMPPVVFSHRTALELARAIQFERLSSNRKAISLPAAPPSKQDVEAAVQELRSRHGDFALSRPVHYLIGGSNGRFRTVRFSPHVCTGEIPSYSLQSLGSGIRSASPLLAFLQEAGRCNDFATLLLLGWEMCGTYQTRRTSWNCGYNVRPLATVRSIREFVKRNPTQHGARTVTRLLPYLADGSASERETIMALLLGLPLKYGGYALGIPRMNYRVDATSEARAIAGRTFFRCDLCWPSARLDVEYQSRESHEGEESRVSDSKRANALENMGWDVVAITNKELDDPTAMDGIAQTIRRRLGIRSRRSNDTQAAKRLELRRTLGLPS